MCGKDNTTKIGRYVGLIDHIVHERFKEGLGRVRVVEVGIGKRK